MRAKRIITILDIGGGVGYFSRELLSQVPSVGSKVREISIHLIGTTHGMMTTDSFISLKGMR